MTANGLLFCGTSTERVCRLLSSAARVLGNIARVKNIRWARIDANMLKHLPDTSLLECYAFAMRDVEIAAVRSFNGRYELLRVDLPEAAGKLSDRISSLDGIQFEVAARHLLPALETDEGMRKLLSGAVIVRLKDWRALKRLF